MICETDRRRHRRLEAVEDATYEGASGGSGRGQGRAMASRAKRLERLRQTSSLRQKAEAQRRFRERESDDFTSDMRYSSCTLEGMLLRIPSSSTCGDSGSGYGHARDARCDQRLVGLQGGVTTPPRSSANSLPNKSPFRSRRSSSGDVSSLGGSKFTNVVPDDTSELSAPGSDVVQDETNAPRLDEKVAAYVTRHVVPALTAAASFKHQGAIDTPRGSRKVLASVDGPDDEISNTGTCTSADSYCVLKGTAHLRRKRIQYNSNEHESSDGESRPQVPRTSTTASNESPLKNREVTLRHHVVTRLHKSLRATGSAEQSSPMPSTSRGTINGNERRGRMGSKLNAEPASSSLTIRCNVRKEKSPVVVRSQHSGHACIGMSRDNDEEAPFDVSFTQTLQSSLMLSTGEDTPFDECHEEVPVDLPFDEHPAATAAAGTNESQEQSIPDHLLTVIDFDPEMIEKNASKSSEGNDLLPGGEEDPTFMESCTYTKSDGRTSRHSRWIEDEPSI